MNESESRNGPGAVCDLSRRAGAPVGLGRRQWLATAIRGTLLGGLLFLSGVLIRRAVASGCFDQGDQSLCGECVLLRRCRLPRAAAARQASRSVMS